jgi:hypothetical protein
MKRAGIAFCADVNPRRFDLYLQRDQLPFDTKTPPAHYSLAEAYELRLFLNLLEAGSVSVEEARNLVVSGTGSLMVHPLNALYGEPDLWVAAVLIRYPMKAEGDGAETFGWHTFFVGGHLSEIAAKADEKVSTFYPEAQLVRVITANASAAAKFVRQRAGELGLPEAEDWSEIQTAAAYRAALMAEFGGKDGGADE